MDLEKDFESEIAIKLGHDKKSQEIRWNRLTEVEKTYMTIYKTKLLADVDFKSLRNLVIEANKIHQKYPDFLMSDVP